MEEIIQEFRVRRERAQIQTLRKGSVPVVELDDCSSFVGGSIFLSVTILFIPLLLSIDAIFNLNTFSLGNAFFAGFIAASIYYLHPILLILGRTVSQGSLPNREILSSFSTGQKFISIIAVSYGVVFFINEVCPFLASLPGAPKNKSWFALWHSTKPHMQFNNFIITWVIVAGLLAMIIPALLTAPGRATLKRTRKSLVSLLPQGPTPFGLWVGASTGMLSQLWHKSGIKADLNVTLSAEDAAQNILVLGGIGAGKTTRLMQPLLVQLLDQDVGGLIFDIKGDVKSAVVKICKATNKQLSIIGPSHNCINLMQGLSPEVGASFLKSAFMLSGGVRVDGFWIDTATELCRNTLGVLSFLPEHYTLQKLYNYIFDPKTNHEINQQLQTLSIGEDQEILLNSYSQYHDLIFANFDEKVKSGVKATLAQVLSPFSHPELINAFCNTAKQSLDIKDVLEGTVYLVDLPLSRWGLGAKVAYTFIKLQFFNLMQKRNQQEGWDQERPVFFMCDEYQEIVSANMDGLSDLNFWDKSRSSKTIGIISAQSVSSFYAAIGNQDLTHALLQNFRQKICFRTEDEATLAMMYNIAGYAKVKRKTTSRVTGNSGGFLEKQTTHASTAESIVETSEPVLTPALFRELSPDQAVALLSIAGHSMDDVLDLFPVFV